MKPISYYKKKTNNYLFDHPVARHSLDYGVGLILCLVSAFLLAFGFRCFTAPSQTLTDIGGNPLYLPRIIAGGLSGFSQIFVKFFQMGGLSEESANTVQSVAYAVLNVPIVLLAYLKIGKKFAIFSAINVVATSLFIQFLPASFVDEISKHFGDQILPRALFAGVCSGLSSAVAFKANQSAGGLDVISFYFASRKGKSVGSYIILFNSFLITIYAILCLFYPDASQLQGIGQTSYNLGRDFVPMLAQIIVILLYSIVYMFAYALVVDFINVRNKKMQVQIITAKDTLPAILIANFPHGATVVSGKGAYTHEDRLIIYMVISLVELKQVIKVIQTADPNAFINVTNLQQVYGKFFIRPLE